jgi:hypothetical protein
MRYRTDIGYESEPDVHREREMRPLDDALEYLRAYARERPEVTALTCFAVGFILGWKLKPW